MTQPRILVRAHAGPIKAFLKLILDFPEPPTPVQYYAAKEAIGRMKATQTAMMIELEALLADVKKRVSREGRLPAPKKAKR